MTDLDPLLHEALANVKGPTQARPSLTDVRRRARRHSRRRMAMTAGVVACTGVATTALIVRRDAPSAVSTVGSEPTGVEAPTTTVYLPADVSTTTAYGLPTLTITPSSVWDALFNARSDSAGAALLFEPADQAQADVMPTPEQFGCTTADCRAMYTYVVWHEIAKQVGFADIADLQAMNPAIDFSQPPHEGDELQTAYPPAVTPNGVDETPTTISVFDGIMLIDGGAPAGAMEDAYQRLAGYNRTIVPASGQQVDH